MSRMRVGVMLPLFVDEPTRITDFARRAEALGFDGVFGFDHLLPLHQPPERPSFEVFSSLAAVAAATDRVSVGTLVTRASLRPAGLLAKLAASVDGVAGGRLILAIGTGDALSRDEHDTFGFPYMGTVIRRRHLEETVTAVRALLAGGTWEGGELVPAVSGPILPGPGRVPPVWVGGLSDEVVRIAARSADAWNGWALSIEGFSRRVQVLRSECQAVGRRVDATWAGIALVGADATETSRIEEDRRDRDLGSDTWIGDVEAATGWLRRLAEAGAAWAILLLAGPADRLELVGREVLPRLREVP